MDEDTYSDSEDTSENYLSGEPLNDRDSIVNNIFDTKRRIEMLKHRLKGEVIENGLWVPKKGGAIVGEDFINKAVVSMESIIDTVNSFSKKNDIECKKILHEAVKAFILDMINDETVDEKDYRTLAKAYEHSLELFLGLVEFGHGANVLKDALAGINSSMNEEKRAGTIKSWFSKI